MPVKVFRTFYIPDIFASYPSFLLLPTFILLSNLSFLYFSDKFSVRTKWHVWYYTTCLPAHRVSTLLSSRHPKTNKKTETGLFCYIKWMFFYACKVLCFKKWFWKFLKNIKKWVKLDKMGWKLTKFLFSLYPKSI